MTSKWGHTDINDMTNGAAGGAPLPELPSQRQCWGWRRAMLWLCSQAGVPLSCCNTGDAALSSALLFCCCRGPARGLFCSRKHQTSCCEECQQQGVNCSASGGQPAGSSARVCLPPWICKMSREETCDSCFASPSISQFHIPLGASIDGAIYNLLAMV